MASRLLIAVKRGVEDLRQFLWCLFNHANLKRPAELENSGSNVC
jgi:hypothetical protein